MAFVRDVKPHPECPDAELAILGYKGEEFHITTPPGHLSAEQVVEVAPTSLSHDGFPRAFRLTS